MNFDSESLCNKINYEWVTNVIHNNKYGRSLTLYILPYSEPTKSLDYPKQKPRRGGGLRKIYTCRKILSRSIILNEDICLVSLYLISPWLTHSNPQIYKAYNAGLQWKIFVANVQYSGLPLYSTLPLSKFISQHGGLPIPDILPV